MTYIVRKRYSHDLGLSASFRQWRAQHSHCRFLHGYSLAICVTFSAQELDDRGWVVDFGGLKPFKAVLQDQFDHVTLVASDDPELEWFVEAERRGIVRLRQVDQIGCEAFAKWIYDVALEWLRGYELAERCSIVEVEVSEHPGNSAVFRPA